MKVLITKRGTFVKDQISMIIVEFKKQITLELFIII